MNGVPDQRLKRLALLFCTILGLSPGTALAQNALPMLPFGEEDKWRAIGRVNATGYSRRKMCTGTLVAPAIVVTAAHCLFRETGHEIALDKLFFVAGVDRGENAGVGRIARIEIHPKARRDGDYDARYDMAVLHLSAPMTGIAPLPLGKGDDAANDTAIIGYHRARPERLSAGFDCPTETYSDAYLVDCPVQHGNSGGPLLLETPDGWRVIGVITADYKGLALATRADGWLLSRLTD